jgi:indolepyruvate ferredoxin oxidoreductase, alpha subunit
LSHIVAEDKVGKRTLLMGNEAIARGAIEAGVQLAAAYPGTPSSEIMETLAAVAEDLGFYAEWSTNEKVAFEVASGGAITGVRSLVCMKNAGLNWVMDMFMTLVYGGVRGGYLIAVADDPGAHYSSNEQDTRFAAMYAEILCFEPADQQEAKDMARLAFDLSEKFELPVFLRSVTRLSHASGDVTFGDMKKDKRKAVFDKHWELPYRWNVYGPPSTLSKHIWLHSRIPMIKEYAESSDFNSLELVEGAKIGIIASGIGSSYAREAIRRLGLEGKISFLKIGTPHPIPEQKVTRLLKSVDKVLMIEEGESVVEIQVRSLANTSSPGVKISGKMAIDRILDPYGELTPTLVADTLAKFVDIKFESVTKDRLAIKEEIKKLIAPRSSTLCAGCPHLGSYWALKVALRRAGGKVWIVNGDIGCYEQGGYGIFASKLNPSFADQSVRYEFDTPYDILDTNYIMGGGIGLSQGEFHAKYEDGSIIAVAGDSTFFHACLPSIVNAVYNKAKVTFLVLDNAWTAMTGHQPNPTTGMTAMGEQSPLFSIEAIAKAIGVGFVKTVDPYNLKETREGIEEAMKYPGFSMVVCRRLCTLQYLREARKSKTKIVPYGISREKCTGCKVCIQLGCPAINFDEAAKKAGIDPLTCTACDMCAQICPFKAISPGGS